MKVLVEVSNNQKQLFLNRNLLKSVIDQVTRGCEIQVYERFEPFLKGEIFLETFSIPEHPQK